MKHELYKDEFVGALVEANWSREEAEAEWEAIQQGQGDSMAIAPSAALAPPTEQPTTITTQGER